MTAFVTKLLLYPNIFDRLFSCFKTNNTIFKKIKTNKILEKENSIFNFSVDESEVLVKISFSDFFQEKKSLDDQD